MDYNEVIEYLKKESERGSKYGLERIKNLLKIFDNPQNQCKVIHVAGTNGKGSFSAMLSNVLKSGGYKVGVFSSPFMKKVNDCIRINGDEISDQKFAEIIEKIIKASEQLTDKPTEFEMLTASAFIIFSEYKCDISIIECGMGGKEDSTNVIDKPLLSVITNVSKDHCGILGNTVEEITVQKSGIIKKGSPVLFGGKDQSAEKIISEEAKKLSASFNAVNYDKLQIIKFTLEKTIINFCEFKDIELNLRGLYQTENAACVLSAVEILRNKGIEINDEAVKQGMSTCSWQGRFEIIKKSPLVIFDGSHNPDGIDMLCKSIESYFKDEKATVLMGVLADKEYKLYDEMLKKYVSKIYTVSPDNSRALDNKELALCFKEAGILSEPCQSIECGLEYALKYAIEKKCPLFIIGSLYLYKDIINKLESI